MAEETPKYQFNPQNFEQEVAEEISKDLNKGKGQQGQGLDQEHQKPQTHQPTTQTHTPKHP